MDAQADAALAATDKRAAQSLLRTLKPLLNLRASIPLPFVTTFLFVALDEGKGVNEYARAAGIHRAAMSRYLRDIGDRARNGGPGLGLVAVVQDDPGVKKTRVVLTAKGRQLAKEVFEQTRRAMRITYSA